MAALLDFQSVVLIIVGSLVFAGILTWASTSFSNLQNETSEASEQLVKCSELDVRFVDQMKNATHFTVFFQANRPVDEILIRFQGAEVRSKVVKNVETNKIYSATVKMSRVENVDAEVKECGSALE